MTNEEICREYREAKSKLKQIAVLADLNACKKWDIVEVLKQAGIDVPGQYRKEKKQSEKKEPPTADLHTRILRAEMEAVPDQTAKRDAGKPRISLVPAEAVRAIARVRMYGVTKYANPQNWRRVEPIRYLDAALRHLLDAVEDLESRDEESGLYSVDHALTDLAFLSALMKREE